MTDILCDWLNNDVQLSKTISPKTFTSDFANGYYVGEVLNKYQLQEDFSQFSQSKTADSKLNNFTRIEPVLKLLGIPFDTNVARSIMNEEPGVSTRLLYQLFIALENKKKANLTGVAMETMRPAAPAKLQGMETLIYKERLKTVTPRQTDLNLRELVDRFHQHQISLEERAFRLRVASAENHRDDRDRHREKQIQRTRQLKVAQSELMAKIEAAVVHIPKPPPNKTAQALEEKRQKHLSEAAEEAMRELDQFDDRLKRMLPSTRVQEESESSSSIGGGMTSPDMEMRQTRPESGVGGVPRDAIQLIMPASNDEYIGRIRKRLEEDQHARAEREKRRRKVLVDCLTAHESQEESRREELMVNRLMRQSQMERRIAVQCMQARHEKSVLKKNRMERERQYQEQREREFAEAMEREKIMAQEAKLACAEELAHEAAIHDQLVAERLEARYRKHYELCFDVTSAITDIVCRIGEYRNYTDRKLPKKLHRDWTALFIEGKPLYEEPEEPSEEQERVDIINEESCKILEETDLTEYRSFTGEWIPPEESEIKECPPPNPIIGYIVNRLHDIVFPPSPPPSKPQYPPYPIKAAILGKCFAGKSTVIQKIMENNRCTTFVVEKLVEEAIDAFRSNETVEESPVEETTVQPTPGENTGRESTDTQATEAAGSSIPVDQSSSVHSLTGSPAVNQSDLKQKSNLSSRSKESDKPRLTNRAKIGQKLVKSLKKGKAMDDALQVEVLVEAIKQVPEGTGWVLDGFPTNYNQAKLLEKALTGYDENAARNRRGRRPTLAQNPRPAPPGEDPKSGLDAVIVLDLEDMNCLNRAIGRTEAPISGDQFHYDSNPPPDGSATGIGKIERVQPIQDSAYDLDQIQARLTGFLDTWPKMEKFYQKFGTSLVRRIDANMDQLALYLEIENVFDEALHKDDKPEQTVAVEPESVEPPPPPPEPEQPPPPPEPLPEPPKEEPGKRSRPGSKRGSRAGSAKRGSSKGSDKGSPAGSRKKSSKASRAGSVEKEKKGKKGSRASSAKSRSRSGSKGSRKGKSPEPPPPEPAEPEEPPGPPPPEPGSEEWEFVDKSIPVEIATALMPLWDAIEESYINALKSNFRELRINREQVIKYFFQIRTDFLDYLRRPDHKQEFITTFQKDFNEISDDMREDEDVMQDLHQRIDDLRDKLFDMTDERKAAAEQKRDEIMKTGWLEDRIGILSNHYISVMQAEYDRFQDSAKFLKDYYKSMNVTIPEEFKPDFARLPLLDLPVEKEEGEGGDGEGGDAETTEVPAKAPSPGGKKGKKDAAPADAEPHELTDAEIEAMFKTKITLLPLRPSSTDIAAATGVTKGGKEKGKGGKDKKQERTIETPVPPSDPDEKVLFDAFWNGVQLVTNYISNEQTLREAEEEAEKAKQAEKEKEKEKNAKDKDKGKGKGKGKGKSRSPSPKKGGKGDKGKDDPPSTPGSTRSRSRSGSAKRKGKKTGGAMTPIKEASNILAQVDAEESVEEKQKREMKEKMKKEYFAALEKEASAARVRMELVKVTGGLIIADLKRKGDEAFKDMFDWIGSRMLKENEIIDELTIILRYAVESHDKISEKIDVTSDNFVLRSDLTTLEGPLPPSRPSPVEHIEADQFKIKQIKEIFKRLKSVSPDGLMSVTEFVNFFQDINLASQDADALPETWRTASSGQLHDLAEALSSDKEYVNWRSFLLAISQPWPWPSQQQLLETLTKFRDLDQLGSGRITREQFDFIDLWFTSSTVPPTPVDPTQPKVIDRLGSVKRLFFDFFLEDEEPKDREVTKGMPTIHGVDYDAMLMHFAASSSPYVGFLRALSLMIGHHVSHSVIPGFEQETACDPVSEEIPNDVDDVMVPIDSLYKVLTFGHGKKGKVSDEEVHEDSEEKKDGVSMDTLVSIYQQLGSDNLDPLPFSMLLRHAALVELILQNKQFKVVDLKAFITDPSDLHSVRTTTE